MEAMIFRIRAGAAGSVRIRRGSAAELLRFGGRIDGMVLPVAVAVEEERVVFRVLGYPLANLDAFLREGVVGVIVVLVPTVGPDDRSRRDDDLPVSFARRHAVLQPLFLHLSPDGLRGAVGKVVGAAEITAFEQKDLEGPAPTEGPVGLGSQRDLLG